GWIFARRHDEVDLVKVEDFTRYPELMWLHRFEQVPAVALALICFAIGGWSGLVGGFFCSTVLVYHATFCINPLATCTAASATSRATTRATTGCSRSSPWARAGTTTTTPIRAACAKGSAGGNTTRPSTSSRRCRGPAWCGI